MLVAAVPAVAQPVSNVPPGLMTPRELQALPFQPADVRSAYGEDPNQFGELRVPKGVGPHPVVVLVHGGCFKAAYATLRDLAPMGDALKARGVATWNIEYRRLGQPGAGWPGTYQDVAAAVDHLRTLAPQHRLDLKRVIFVGHSAGGHLALWAAARGRLPAGSQIAGAQPLKPIGAINLAGAFDMRTNIDNYHAECRDPVITQMMGGTPESAPEHYRQASVAALLPLGVPHTLIWGEHETFMPRPLAEAYVAQARDAGDDAVLRVIPRAGHFEIASPNTPAWTIVQGEILRLLGRP
jgi:acetyl esterase/lipase